MKKFFATVTIGYTSSDADVYRFVSFVDDEDSIPTEDFDSKLFSAVLMSSLSPSLVPYIQSIDSYVEDYEALDFSNAAFLRNPVVTLNMLSNLEKNLATDIAFALSYTAHNDLLPLRVDGLDPSTNTLMTLFSVLSPNYRVFLVK
ncbi:MAG: hypothetical protein [Chaetfec virus UA24_2285]|nr:MAG: hypothetical protein [Chaetfec virus UA24_2285]